jgi:hypothetical protein
MILNSWEKSEIEREEGLPQIGLKGMKNMCAAYL